MTETKKILVVEDEGPIRALWTRFLEKWGFSTDMAENGLIAMEKTRQEKYLLVITDLAMPVMTGQELIYKLKEEKPETEIIVTTGHGSIEVAVEMMKAGAYDFLTKPINFNHAEIIIRKCLETIEAREENVQLRQKNKDLEELSELKEKFIAITSHELRTPVSIINNIVEILKPEMESHGFSKMFQLINRSSNHLSEIVEQMHDISDLKSPKMDLIKDDIDLYSVCSDIKEEFDWVQQKRNHNINWVIPEGLRLNADQLKIKKVLRELLQNAIKYTEDGGEIKIEAIRENEHSIKIEVSDNGIGIPEEKLDKIFYLFYEVVDSLQHHTSKNDFLGGGMGIGLSIVNDIVKAHQGTLEVESKVGEGSRFIVRLP